MLKVKSKCGTCNGELDEVNIFCQLCFPKKCKKCIKEWIESAKDLKL